MHIDPLNETKQPDTGEVSRGRWWTEALISVEQSSDGMEQYWSTFWSSPWPCLLT